MVMMSGGDCYTRRVGDTDIVNAYERYVNEIERMNDLMDTDVEPFDYHTFEEMYWENKINE